MAATLQDSYFAGAPTVTMTSRSDAATDLTRTLVTVNARQAKWMTHLALTATDIVAFASVLGLLELTSMVFAPAFSTPIWSAGLLIPLLLASFVTLGLYQHTRMHPADEMRLASQVTLALGITAAVAVYISGSNSGMAPVLGAAGGLGAVVVPLCRGFFRVICARANWWGQSAIIIGSEEEASAVVDTLRRWPEIGLRPVAVLTDSHVDAHQGIWTGSRSMALHLAANHDIPCAIVAEPSMDAEARDKLIARYSKFFENVLVVPDVKKGAAALWRTGRSHQGLVAYGVSHYELQVGASIAKRVADLIGAAILTILAAPVLAVIALLIKIDSPGPVFYSQNRMGRQGRCFSVQKFRTMKVNADAVLQEMLDSDPALRREYEQFHKLENDPRVTRIGRVLRRYSLDELPQLFNVIVGDMSLVGPRAYMPRELPQMKNLAQIVLQTPPGITGLWQVSGRNALSFERRVDLDVHYFKNWSPWLDLYLLIRTVPVVLSGDGAS